MTISSFGFVDLVAADRDLVVTSAHDHACRVEPRVSSLAWHCDFGRLVAGLARLARPASRRVPGDGDARLVYTDPAGILDAPLRRRIEIWPAAEHGDGVVRPAELWSIKVTGEGLVVESVSWWNSAPALDHQIGLAIDLAHRMTARR